MRNHKVHQKRSGFREPKSITRKKHLRPEPVTVDCSSVTLQLIDAKFAEIEKSFKVLINRKEIATA